ncbi:unnamed protein product [Blepharisma stoltei]|uniref:Uncharacterized protein n=1 Tax=Blepharisma stoltei TaxID=1481888 RepID=A0AAU9JPQ2_9CILI|nr:unnamed protein product [Blepharisma stoltei]
MFQGENQRDQIIKPNFQVYGKNLPPISSIKNQPNISQGSNNLSNLSQNDPSSYLSRAKLSRNQSECSIVSNIPMPGKYLDLEVQPIQNNDSAVPKQSTIMNFNLRKNAAEAFKFSQFKPKEGIPPMLKAVALKRSYSQQDKVRDVIKPSSVSYFESSRREPVAGYSEIYTSEESFKPAFILSSSAQMGKVPKNDWKTLSEPPSIYTLNEQSKSTIIRSGIINKSEQDMRSIWSKDSYKAQSEFYRTTSNEEILRTSILETDNFSADQQNPPSDCRMPENVPPKDITFITSVNANQNQNPDINEVKSEPVFQDLSDVASYKSSIQPSICLKPLIKETNSSEKSQKWYGVPQKVRFLVNENYVQTLKPCNFYEEHKDLLPVFPVKKYRHPKLLLKGSAVKEGNLIRKEIVKDEDHLIRVLNREGTPWVQYNLKPAHQVRQDPFCTNYGELLKLDIVKGGGDLGKSLGEFFKVNADAECVFSHDGISEGSLGLNSRR